MPLKAPKVVGRLTKQIQSLQPNVVHTHQIAATFYAGAAARRARTPLIVDTEHGKNYETRSRTRWLGRFAVRSFCVSQHIADELRAWRIAPRGKIDRVPNGIDVDHFRHCKAPEAALEIAWLPWGAWSAADLLARMKARILAIA